jgi:hypothetical protein
MERPISEDHAKMVSSNQALKEVEELIVLAQVNRVRKRGSSNDHSFPDIKVQGDQTRCGHP